ncbi:hypothetical protein UlMin_000654 [Ulmus minor]
MEVINGQLSVLTLQSTIYDGIQGTQKLDPELNRIREVVKNGTNTEFSLSPDGILSLKGKICIPNDEDLRNQLLEEAHTTPYSVHPGATNMYKDMKEVFWWSGMKKDVENYVAKCLVCQKIKAEHQRPAGVLQPIEIPKWKWEQISMDFVVGLPKTTNGYDAMWVIIDRLTKSAHFLPIKITSSLEQLADLRCRSPAHWYETGEKLIAAPDFVESTTEAVRLIQKRMKTAQSRQKSYADRRRRPLEFQVGDLVFLKVAPMKGVMRFGKKESKGEELQFRSDSSRKGSRGGFPRRGERTERGGGDASLCMCLCIYCIV